jgi:hypothetical protein
MEGYTDEQAQTGTQADRWTQEDRQQGDLESHFLFRQNNEGRQKIVTASVV